MRTPGRVSHCTVFLLAIVSCGGPTEPPASRLQLRMDTHRVAPYLLVTVTLPGASLGSSQVTGRIRSNPVNLAVVNDSQAVFLAPDLAPGPAALEVTVGRRSGSERFVVVPSDSLPRPYSYVDSILVAMDSALVGIESDTTLSSRLNATGATGLLADVRALRTAVASFRMGLDSLSPATVTRLAQLLHANAGVAAPAPGARFAQLTGYVDGCASGAKVRLLQDAAFWVTALVLFNASLVATPASLPVVFIATIVFATATDLFIADIASVAHDCVVQSGAPTNAPPVELKVGVARAISPVVLYDGTPTIVPFHSTYESFSRAAANGSPVLTAIVDALDQAAARWNAVQGLLPLPLVARIPTVDDLPARVLDLPTDPSFLTVSAPTGGVQLASFPASTGLAIAASAPLGTALPTTFAFTLTYSDPGIRNAVTTAQASLSGIGASPVVGLYALVAVNGQPLPATAGGQQFTSGSILLGSTGTWTGTTTPVGCCEDSGPYGVTGVQADGSASLALTNSRTGAVYSGAVTPDGKTLVVTSQIVATYVR